MRTTVHPGLLGPADLARMQAELDGLGVVGWTHQAFRPDGCTPESLAALSRLPLDATV